MALKGVLLRCDERNFWGSGTTLGYVLRPGSKQSAMNELSIIVPTVIDLEMLAQLLSVPVSHMVATTYLAELARLYGNEHLHAKLLSSSFTFHVCPACIAEERKLSRWLTLPHIMHCPEHHLALVSSCSCGAALPTRYATRLYTQDWEWVNRRDTGKRGKNCVFLTRGIPIMRTFPEKEDTEKV